MIIMIIMMIIKNKIRIITIMVTIKTIIEGHSGLDVAIEGTLVSTIMEVGCMYDVPYSITTG